MTIKTDFENRFPEFDQADIDQYVPILEDVWPAYYGKDYEDNKETVLNLIAHLVVMETQSGSGPMQAVQSKSAGNLSASYHAREQGRMEDFFASTRYGQRFLFLIRLGGGAKFV